METSQNARKNTSTAHSDIELLMIAFFQKSPPKIPVKEKKTLRGFLKDTYLADQTKFKVIATSLIEDDLIFKGTYSSFIERTKTSSTPPTEIDTQSFHNLIDALNISGNIHNFLDVTSKKTVDKKNKEIRGGIPMPDPTEGISLMKDQGKRASHREFWTDHSKGWNDDANKKQAHFQARIPRETNIKVNAFLKATGMKKVTLTDEALNNFIDDYKYSDEELKLLVQKLKPN